MTERLDEKQVGGDHYRAKALTPWQVIDATFTREQAVGFYRGNVLKYLLRYQDKGGLDDLRKAQHYLEKLIEVVAAHAEAT